MRLAFLDQPVRGDEAYAFLNFASVERGSLFAYPAPANHVLHTLLVRVSSTIGGSSPEVLRVPGLVAGLAAIAMTCVLARTLIGPRGGVFAGAFMAASPFMVLYDTLSRGYPLLVLATVTWAWLGHRAIADPSRWRLLVLVVIGALGMFVMPSFAMPLAGMFVWLLLIAERPRDTLRRVVLPLAGGIPALSGLLYLPVIVQNGWSALFSNDTVAALPWTDFASRIPAHLTDVWFHWWRDVPLPVVLGIVALAAWGSFTTWKENRVVALLLPAMVAGAMVLFFAKHAIPFPRTWIFLTPALAVVADAGFVNLATRLTSVPRAALLASPVLLAGLLAFHLVRTGAVARYGDIGSFDDAQAVAAYLGANMAVIDHLRADGYTIGATVNYHLFRAGGLTRRPTGPPRTFVVTQRKPDSARQLANGLQRVHSIGDTDIYVAPR